MTPETEQADVKQLLEQATPLPWVVQVPGEHDIGAGTVFIDTHAYEGGPEPVIADGKYPINESDARLIVHAVNRLPAYEKAVEALERLVNDGRDLCRHAEHGHECDSPELTDAEGAIERARAALAELRGADQ